MAEGVTIDLHCLTGVNISSDKTCVSIAAGESWGEVYAHLATADLVVAGGRSSQGGIGGLALGGDFHVIRFIKDFLTEPQVDFPFLPKSQGFCVGQYRQFQVRTRQRRYCQCKRQREQRTFHRLGGRLL